MTLNKIVITRFTPPGCTREAVVSAMLEDGKLAEVYLDDPIKRSVLNNIYIGKVQNIVKNINAAFIEFEKGCVGYYPLEELPTAIFTKKQGKKPLVIGDELLVQVAKEPIKTKAAVLTTNLSFTGKCFVLTTGRKGIGMSSKLSGEGKTQLKQLVNTNRSGKYGVIVRTNAQEAPEDVLLSELKLLEQKMDDMLGKAQYHTAFSLIHGARADYTRLLANAYADQKDEIVTDDEALYEEIKGYLEQYQPEDAAKLVLYEDKLLPLYKLYNMEKQLEDVRKTRIWLKSGAYLIMEQTEAFCVIDVNTGKCEGGKKKQDTFLKINLEAAKECARQIRLRNLSGIILVDFINMAGPKDDHALMEQFACMVNRDRIKTTVVDMTALGIVEVTRKKEHCSLREAMEKF